MTKEQPFGDSPFTVKTQLFLKPFISAIKSVLNVERYLSSIVSELIFPSSLDFCITWQTFITSLISVIKLISASGCLISIATVDNKGEGDGTKLAEGDAESRGLGVGVKLGVTVGEGLLVGFEVLGVEEEVVEVGEGVGVKLGLVVNKGFGVLTTFFTRLGVGVLDTEALGVVVNPKTAGVSSGVGLKEGVSLVEKF